jgi:hypothetical protein
VGKNSGSLTRLLICSQCDACINDLGSCNGRGIVVAIIQSPAWLTTRVHLHADLPGNHACRDMVVEMLLVGRYLYKDFPDTFDLWFCQNDRPCQCDKNKLNIPFLQVCRCSARCPMHSRQQWKPPAQLLTVQREERGCQCCWSDMCVACAHR